MVDRFPKLQNRLLVLWAPGSSNVVGTKQIAGEEGVPPKVQQILGSSTVACGNRKDVCVHKPDGSVLLEAVLP